MTNHSLIISSLTQQCQHLSPLFSSLAHPHCRHHLTEPMNESPATQLPPELLLVIFSHLQNSQDEEQADQISLKFATLVCRAFTEPAQAILWQSGATLEGAGDLEKFIKSASRRRVGPKELTVKDGRDAIDEKLLIRLWDSIRGVARLTIISGETRVSAETFNHAALAGS